MVLWGWGNGVMGFLSLGDWGWDVGYGVFVRELR